MRTRRKKRPKKHRDRKGIYILPNLFTSASLFGGFYAIIAAIQGRYEAGAVAVVLSGILDGIDGRIARYTKTSSLFGTEYDSLADLVAFGVAPAIIAYQWALRPFGRLGWLAAFMYVICGALRLARFNVQKSQAEMSFFKGLPIPAAACSIASLILFSGMFKNLMIGRPIFILILIYTLSFLMVSTVNYPSFKEFEIRARKPFNVLVWVILVLMVVAYKPKVMLFVIMVSYLVSGPVVTALRLPRRREEKKEVKQEHLCQVGEGERGHIKDGKVIG
ncbi:MAG: CDP-diacylglycerol--serine O-phosphatidyltransferase [Deltaproteobacteria bacterium]|nr:CDP-diacylglycerol--serine O-phosphatidyltransferase [Deltaproteobacteria bacterium]